MVTQKLLFNQDAHVEVAVNCNEDHTQDTPDEEDEDASCPMEEDPIVSLDTLSDKYTYNI